jgi:hypothetical protein
MRNGECRGKDCKSCVHDPIKDKCEWWLTKGKGAAERDQRFAQRTPAVPPEPVCEIKQRGTGAWKDGDIIPSGTGLCTEHFKCDAKPAKDERPNAGCGFLVRHTDDIMRSGECSGKDCKACVHDPIKDKCEWWLSTGK